MKFASHLFACTLGAIIAGYCSYQWLEHSRSVTPLPSIQVVRPIAPPPPTPSGPSATTLEQVNRTNADLKARLAKAESQLSENNTLLVQTRARLEELRRPMTADMSSSTLSAQLKSGESVVTGGYLLPDGKRLYAFVQPTVQLVNGENLVRINSRVRAITDDAGSAVGLDGLATNAANTIQHGEVWFADEQAAVLSLLDESAGTDALAYPALTLRSGGSGMLELNGLTLKVTPVLGADQQTMDLEVRLEQQSAPAGN